MQAAGTDAARSADRGDRVRRLVGVEVPVLAALDGYQLLDVDASGGAHVAAVSLALTPVLSPKLSETVPVTLAVLVAGDRGHGAKPERLVCTIQDRVAGAVEADDAIRNLSVSDIQATGLTAPETYISRPAPNRMNLFQKSRIKRPVAWGRPAFP
jgi:hypothetical protein